MKKRILLLSILLISEILFVKAQTEYVSGDGSMTIRVDKLKLSNSRDNDNPSISSTTVRSEYHDPAPSSGDVMSSIYLDKHRKELDLALTAWAIRDWDGVIKHLKESQAYLTNTKYYEPWIAQARGLKEWDRGVEMHNKKMWDKAILFYNKALKHVTDSEDIKLLRSNINECTFSKAWEDGIAEAKARRWDSAIAKYKEALQYHPENETLKSNVVGCSFQRTKDLAQKYLKEDNWVEAGVFNNILWKNFDDKAAETEYSRCLTQISVLGQYGLFNTRLEEEKQKLPFLNKDW